MSKKEHEARIGLRTKAFIELQELQQETEIECPLAAQALQRAHTSLTKGDPWDTMRYLGEAIGNIQVYLAVAVMEDTSRSRLFTHLETWALTTISTVRSILELEWERKR